MFVHTKCRPTKLGGRAWENIKSISHIPYKLGYPYHEENNPT